MGNPKEVTCTEAGLTKEDVYTLIFTEMKKHQDGLEMKNIYDIINNKLKEENEILSEQGKASLRRLINSNAVQEGYGLYPIKFTRLSDFP